MLCITPTWKGAMLNLPNLHDPLLALSTFKMSNFLHMILKEKESGGQVLCGYTSADADQAHEHARMMGPICLLVGFPYKKGASQLSLYRKQDDLHYKPEHCCPIDD